jgi:hypothetical protein
MFYKYPRIYYLSSRGECRRSLSDFRCFGTGTGKWNRGPREFREHVQGELQAVGTFFNGSSYVRINQPNIQDSRTWTLAEAPYLQQNSYTNAAGVYYMERLQPDTYTLLVNGKPAQPSTITLNESSKPFDELNLLQMTKQGT